MSGIFIHVKHSHSRVMIQPSALWGIFFLAHSGKQVFHKVLWKRINRNAMFWTIVLSVYFLLITLGLFVMSCLSAAMHIISKVRKKCGLNRQTEHTYLKRINWSICLSLILYSVCFAPDVLRDQHLYFCIFSIIKLCILLSHAGTTQETFGGNRPKLSSCTELF